MGDGGAEDEGDNNSYEDQPLLDEQDVVDVKDEEMDFLLDDQEGRDSRDSTGRFTFISWNGLESLSGRQCFRSGSRRAKITNKNWGKCRNSCFEVLGCSLLRAEGFFCSLDVLFWRPRDR